MRKKGATRFCIFICKVVDGTVRSAILCILVEVNFDGVNPSEMAY